jgi:hypothetical protein
MALMFIITIKGSILSIRSMRRPLTNYFKSIRDGADVLHYHIGIHPVHSPHEEAATNYFKSIRDGTDVHYYHKGIHPVHLLHEKAANKLFQIHKRWR